MPIASSFRSTSYSVQIIRRKTRVVRALWLASSMPGTIRKLAGAGFAVAGNVTEESGTARETTGFRDELPNQFEH
jgi:hypothetical protein